MTNFPNSQSRRDISYRVHGYSNLKLHETRGPTIFVRGEGVRVFDDDGRSYIEGLAGLWCASLGYGQQRLINAATKQMGKLAYYHEFAHKTTDVTIELAARLIDLSPVPMSKVLFGNSGSEVTDLAIKLIWYFNNAVGRPKKKKIISRIKGYHGVTVAAASLTGLPYLHDDFDLPIERIIHTDCPHFYRYGRSGESEEAFASRCAESLEKLIIDEGPETVAAMYCEPILGAGGVIVPPRTYYEKIQAVLQKYDILLVADEVINGFGRTGNMWGTQTMGLKPDFISCAKQLSAAYLPISALLISDRIYQAMVKQSEKLGIFGHGSTYAGHPVAAAVALETLKIYEDENILDHVKKISPVLQDGLCNFNKHPLVGEIRGKGLIAAIELVKDKETGEPFESKYKVGAYLQMRIEQKGVILRALGDSLAFCPPLIINEEEIKEILAATAKSLDETLDWVNAGMPT
ncbi:MAG: aspartate aminotransferase family protein [Magnetovibrio sp.]|nr:aspartate aminotransferase family protein [Magnetovibrio sp.]